MNGRQKKKEFRKFILYGEGYRQNRERLRRINVEWRKDSRKLRISLWYGQKYSWPNRYHNKTAAKEHIKRNMETLCVKWGWYKWDGCRR